MSPARQNWSAEGFVESDLPYSLATRCSLSIKPKIEFLLARDELLAVSGQEQLVLGISERGPNTVHLAFSAPLAYTIWTARAPNAVVTVRICGAITSQHCLVPQLSAPQ